MDNQPPDPSSTPPPEQSPGWNPVPPPPGMAPPPPPPDVPPAPGWNPAPPPPGAPPPPQPWAQPPPQPPYAQPPAQPAYPQPPYGVPPTGYPPAGYGYAQPVFAGAGGGRFAGFWIRFVAAVIDGFILAIPIWIVIAATGAFHCANTSIVNVNGYTTLTPTCTFNPSAQILLLILELVYFVGMWSTGATVGQRLLSLRVVDQSSGANIALGRAFIRAVGYIISAIPFGLGLIWAGFDLRKQGWHDKIAGTVVVRR